MKFHSLFSFLKSRSAPRTKRPSTNRLPHLGRLQIEPLEDRSLPSTFFAYNLGTLGGRGSQLTDINVHGQVVGLSATDAGGPSQGVEHAFVWDRGTMIDLGSLDGPTSSSSAWGINDSGQVAGGSNRLDPNGFSRSRAFLVTPEDTDGNGQPDRWYRDNDSNGINDLMRDLGTLGGDSAYATGVNNAGQVVGMANTADGGLYAFRWQNGQMTSLGSLGGSTNRWSYGYGINDSGQVVGVSSASNSTPAFQWDSARGLTNLGTLPGHDHAVAFDITNSGVVAGTSGSYEASRAVTWTPSTPNGVPGSAVSLGTLPGDTASEAFDINNSGQVVGLSHTYFQDQEGYWYRPASRPVRWQGGGVTALADLMPAGSGWYFRSVSAINDAGQIVGGGGRAGDYGDGFLMSPTDLGLPLLSIGDVTITEGNGGVSNAVFTVTLSAASSKIVTATYAAAPGSAVQNLDYVASSGTVTFNPGETSRTITVPVYADTLDESDEMFVVNLSRTTNAAIADGQATGTINDDDPVPTLRVNDIVVVEGNSGTSDAVFTVSLSPAADRERTVSFQTEGYNDEYYYSNEFEVSGGDLTFAPGETTKSVTVRVYGDTIPEPDETFRVFATYQGATSLSAEGTATIRNDEPVIPMPDVSDPTLVEGAGTTNAVFTVTLVMGPLAAPATFTYQTANGSAEAGSDYAAANGTITFAPGETQKTIAVPVYGDDRYEVNESFSLLVSNPTQLPYTQDTGHATITNDDPIPTVSISDIAAHEGNTGTTEFAFTVSLSAPSGVSLGYYYASESGSAWSVADFQDVSGFVGFNPGETTRTVVVSVIGDLLLEADETFFVQLYDWPWYEEYPIPITGASGTGTILNDDSNLPLVTIGDVAVSEGNTGTRSAVFTVSLSAPSSQSVAVNFSTANGTAGASDYQANTGTLTFAPGQTSRTVTVVVSGDRVGEPNETFFVNLSSPTNATIANGQALGTITDDEPRISISDVTKAEGNKNKTTLFTFTVTLSAAYDQPVTMSFRTANGTATTSDSDYVAKTGTLTFAPGETTKTITIEVKGDSKKEADETFYIDLTGLSNNGLFTKSRGVGTILNDD